MYLFNNAFIYFKMGYASAMAWILFVLILVCTASPSYDARRVYYAGHDVAKRRPGRLILKSVLSHAALISLSIVFLIPFAWLLTSSFKSESHLFTKYPEWILEASTFISTTAPGEVIRQEVLEYHPSSTTNRFSQGTPGKDDQGDAGRSPGDPLLKELFTVDPPADLRDMDKGIIDEALKAAFAGFGAHCRRFRGFIQSQKAAGGRFSRVRRPTRSSIRTAELMCTPTSRRGWSSTPIASKRKPGRRAGTTSRHRRFPFQPVSAEYAVHRRVHRARTVLSSSWVAFGFSILEWRGVTSCST